MISHRSTRSIFSAWLLDRQSLLVCRILDASNRPLIISPARTLGAFASKKNFTIAYRHQRHSCIPHSLLGSQGLVHRNFMHATSDHQSQNDRKGSERNLGQTDIQSQSGVISRITAQIFPQWRQPKQPPTTSPQPASAPLESNIPRPESTPIKIQLQVDGRFAWWERWFQDFKDTWEMVFAARKLIFIFGSIFFIVNRLYIYEADYLWSVFNKGKPTSTVAHWLDSFSKVSMPRLPTYSEPSLTYLLIGFVPSEWFRTPLNLFTQISCSFACINNSNVKDNCLLLLLLVPLLKQVMSSKKIFIAYIVGGMIAVNFNCASHYFFNPYARLPADELQRKIDAVPLLEHQRAHRSKLWSDARDKLSTLSQELMDMKDAEMRKHKSDSQPIDKSLVEEKKSRTRGTTETDKEVIEEDLRHKGPREGNPNDTEFDADGSRLEERTGLEERAGLGERTELEERTGLEKRTGLEEQTEPGANEETGEESLKDEPTKKKGIKIILTEDNLIQVEPIEQESSTPEPVEAEKKDSAKEIQEKMDKVEETKKEIASLQETQLLFDYAGVSLGSSCSMTCLCMSHPIIRISIQSPPFPKTQKLSKLTVSNLI